MGQPDGSSKLCLSCHDGTVALENFGGVTTGTTEITGDALMGTDLSNDHPVSFTYNTALATADGELEDPSTGLSGLGGTIDDDMLISGKMQCSSCHDVHNTAGINYMLLKSNSASALCLTCHIK
jgi:predicted CXXCH cytochrome family protein